MKQALSIKPHDVAILLKLVAKGESVWRQVDLANELEISQSEIAKSLVRLKKANLIYGKEVNKLSVKEFLIHALKYLFPAEFGPLEVGVPTGVSSPLFNSILDQKNKDKYVWPDPKGSARGQIFKPLYPKLSSAALKDPEFYELVAISDVLRSGRAREKELAIKELKNRL